jgi:hypothetical protein
MPTSLPTQTDSIAAISARRCLLLIGKFFAESLSALAARMERSTAFCGALLLAATLPCIILKACFSHLTCDEVYTFRIAQQPTLARLFAVSRTIDLHPPLHYLAERAALSTHLPTLLAARLPSILATLGTLLFLFLFSGRRLGFLFGVVSAALFFFMPSFDFAWSNRPYALWLCCLACSMWLWQRAADRPWPSAPLLFLSLSAMTADYMGGLLCILPFLLAEFVRSRQHPRRPIAWPAWIALALPCICSVLYFHQVASFATNSFAPAFLHWFSTTVDTYTGMLALPGIVLISCVAVALILQAASTSPPPGTPANAGSFSSAELTLALGLAGLPVLVGTLAAFHRNPFFPRYGACAAVGVAILATWTIHRFAPSARLVAALIAVGLLIGGAVEATTARWPTFSPTRAAAATGVPALHLDRLDPSLPIAIASPAVYTEMSAREPDNLLPRLYYLTDRPFAIHYSGSTVFENESIVAHLLGYRTSTAPLQSFLAAHRSFYLVADYTEPEEWLPRALMVSGARLQYLGKFNSIYHDDDLYLVTVTPSS